MIKNILAIDDSAVDAADPLGDADDGGLRGDASRRTATKGSKAALAERFDLVLTDQHMPGKSGLDLIAELRAQPGLQGDADPRPHDRESASRSRTRRAAAGATGWIEKPLDPDLLTELVAALSEASARR